MAGIVLSPATYERIDRLIGKRPGDKGGYAVGSGVRQVIHVKVTGDPDEDRKYPCTPTAYQPNEGSWKDYGEDAECYVYEANEQDLRNGDRYIAIRYGQTDDGKWIFVADNMYPLVKCHLEWKQDPDDNDKWKLDVTPETLAGCGLALEVDGTCDKLKVDPAQIVGCGLKVQEDNPDDPDDSSDSYGTTSGCRIDVDAEALAGCGLKAADASDGGCQLEIDMDEVSGPTFTAITSIAGDGCGIQYDVTTYTVKTNQCGVFIGLETGEATTWSVDLAACCDCSSDSDSDSSSCGGAYWCVDGVCTWIEDCGSSDSSSSDCGGWTEAGYYCISNSLANLCTYLGSCEEAQSELASRDGVIGGGPYATAEDCPCAGGGVGMLAVTAQSITGPYATVEECEAACGDSSSTGTYYCVQITDSTSPGAACPDIGEIVCIDGTTASWANGIGVSPAVVGCGGGQTYTADVVGGPFDSTCNGGCECVYPGPGWYCDPDNTDAMTQCLYIDSCEAYLPGLVGPYETADECHAACGDSSGGTPCDGTQDVGCGSKGYIMTGGVWVDDGEVYCSCGSAPYPTIDSPEGTHTTMYCCPDSELHTQSVEELIYPASQPKLELEI